MLKNVRNISFKLDKNGCDFSHYREKIDNYWNEFSKEHPDMFNFMPSAKSRVPKPQNTFSGSTSTDRRRTVLPSFSIQNLVRGSSAAPAARHDGPCSMATAPIARLNAIFIGGSPLRLAPMRAISPNMGCRGLVYQIPANRHKH